MNNPRKRNPNQSKNETCNLFRLIFVRRFEGMRLYRISIKIGIQLLIQITLMIKESRQSKSKATLSIKCECTIFHNNLQLNTKKKSKLSIIEFYKDKMILTITPKGQNDIYEMPIKTLKIIHKKFIEQGKITLQYDGIYLKQINNHESLKSKKQNNNSLDLATEKNNQEAQLIKQRYLEGICQIFINNGSKQNLDLLIKMLIEAKKSGIVKDKEMNKKNEVKKVEKQETKIKKQHFITNISKEEQKVPTKKDLMKLVKTFNNPLPKNTHDQAKGHKKQIHKPLITLLNLPRVVLKQIFAYIGIHLDYRLISKQLEKFVLMNITSLKLRDEIEEQAFNKIAKYAINVRCRMKNVKNLQLVDRYEDAELKENRAKRLDFSHWKQISAKNINQLKGLKIYSLSVNYGIKFDFSNFYGLRLVELRLTGSSIISRNSSIKDEQILYLVNNVNDLKVLQIPFISTKLFLDIRNPEKMTEITIGILNIVHAQEKWQNLSKFKNMQIFRVSETLKHGSKDFSTIYNITYPQDSLRTLELGINVSRESWQRIPISLHNLKLNGQFRNRHMEQVYLPSLQFLDISEAPNLSPQFLQNYQNIRVMSSWDRSNVDYANNYFQPQNIRIGSTRCYSPYN